MIDTSTFMWYTNNKTTSIWAHTEMGEVQVADCRNKLVSIRSQRLHARLCSEAPAMLALLTEAADNMDAEQFAEFTQILQRVHGQSAEE
jgi:hypothetical protein